MTIAPDYPNATDRRPVTQPWDPSVAVEYVEVVSNFLVKDQYFHLVVRCGELVSRAQPGQFFQLLCPHPLGEHPFLRRPMSLYAADRTEKKIEFLYKVTGAGTRGLRELTEGDSLSIVGPLGNGFTVGKDLRKIICVARGAGIATMAPLVGAVRELGLSVTVILSARHREALIMEGLPADPEVDIITVTDSDGTSDPLAVEQLLRELILKGRCDAFFTCGSERLIRVQQKLAGEFNLPGQAAIEQQMACGLGLCHCCVRDFAIDGEIVQRRVCWDGPVFDLKEIYRG